MLFTINFLAVKIIFNPLSTNPTKWSNTLEQFVGKSQQIAYLGNAYVRYFVFFS